MNLVFKPTISPTLQACNQWQHLLQCCSATGQYTSEKMLRRRYTCSNNPVCLVNMQQMQIQSSWCTERGHSNPRKVGVKTQNAMHLFSVNRETLQSTGKQWASFCPHSLSLCKTTHYHHYSCSFCSHTQKHSRTPLRVPRCNALLQNWVLISVEQDIVSLDGLTK